MKTFNDIQELNYNDLAFFTGLSVNDSKWEIAAKFGKTVFSQDGVPIIGKEETIKPLYFNFTIRSNSKLEGQNKMEYLVNYYNKGTHKHQLMEFSQNEAYINALKFTGKYSILNEILNREQLLQLQKKWLVMHLRLSNNYASSKVQQFIEDNAWAKAYLSQDSISLKYSVNERV